MTTTPPQGQNPYAQGQQPYGQPQQPQAPYPPQGGQPQQPGQVPYAPFPNQGVPAPQPPRRKVSFKLIKNIVIVLAVLGVAIGSFIASRDDADTASVGDCMHRGSSSSTDPDLEVVDCKSTKAQYVVLAKIKGKYTGDVAASTKCEAEAKDFEYVYTQSGDGSDFLLCLKGKK
ncbi:LppU/SCO3897 family protein [Streptomyces longwoodensis]|uniref:LppU/SCO3897 family protein n=1 Tax=Streptomyces longwoodensis TaxID=68231 RepID=UPI0038103F87